MKTIGLIGGMSWESTVQRRKVKIQMEDSAVNITIVHGQSHKGSTYHIAKILSEKLKGEVTEFFLPRDFHSFCVGCTNCFGKSETLCPHFESLKPITEALDKVLPQLSVLPIE